MKRAFCAALLSGFFVLPAQAEPGVAGEVYGPSVHQGETELEARFGYLTGGEADGEWAFIGEAAYGVTDWWRPAILFEAEREPGDDAEIEAIAFENVFDLVPTREWPVHFGLYAEYEANLHSGPDKAEFKLIAEHEEGSLRTRVNLITERELGDDASDDWEFGYAAQVLYETEHDFALGLEAYGDVGDSDDFGDLSDHSHYVGPVLEFAPFESDDGEMEVMVGYLFGVGDAEADGLFKLTIEWEI